jgi:hypothetical protein
VTPSVVLSNPDYPLLAKHGVRIYEQVYGKHLHMGVDREDFIKALKAIGIYEWWMSEERAYTMTPLGMYPWDAERVLREGPKWAKEGK